MNFTEAKAKKKELESKMNDFTAILQKFPKGDMGLIPDEVKFSDAYRFAKSNFNGAFQELRKFNQSYIKQFKAELALERKNKRLALNNGTC